MDGEKGSMARGSGAADNETDACSIWERTVSDAGRHAQRRGAESRGGPAGWSVWTW